LEGDGAKHQDVDHERGWIAAVFEEREYEAPRDTEENGDEAFAEESLRSDEVRAEEEVEAGEDNAYRILLKIHNLNAIMIFDYYYQSILRDLRNEVWLVHAKGYLDAPKLCCEELLNPIRSRMEDDPEAPEGWTMPYIVDLLLPTIFFNTKHGIEVMLKTILQRLNLENSDSHNSIDLFNLVKKEVLSVKWIPNPEQGLGADRIAKILDGDMGKLRGLVLYFANNMFVHEKLNKGPIPDPFNELFRYPEMKRIGMPFSFDDLIQKVTDEDIRGLKKKIAQTQRLLLNLGYLIAVQKRYFPESFNSQTGEATG